MWGMYRKVLLSVSPGRVMPRRPPYSGVSWNATLTRGKACTLPAATQNISICNAEYQNLPDPTGPFRPACPTFPTTKILEAWEASQQQEQERKQGDSSVTRTTLISSSLQEGREAAPSSGTADEFDGQKQKQKQQTNGAQAKDAGEDVPTLTLPKPNPFIPTKFAIKEAPAAAPSPSEGDGKGQEGPQKLLNKPCPRKVVRESAAGAAAAAAAGVVMLTLWHLQDRIFMQPRAAIFMKVMKP